jgi:hypothetical protein
LTEIDVPAVVARYRVGGVTLAGAVNEVIRGQQLAAIPGQVECPYIHDRFSIRRGILPCGYCGAAV